MNRYFLTVFTLCTTIAVHAQVDRNTLRNGATMKFVPGTSIMNTTPSAGTATMPMGSSLIMKPVTDQPYSSEVLSNQSENNRPHDVNTQRKDNCHANKTTNKPDDSNTTDDSYTYGGLHRGRPLASMLRMALALHSKSIPPISPRSASMDGWQQGAICSILTGTGPMSQAVDCMPNWAIGSTIIGQPTSTDRRVW